jgi:hypothetical protein
MKLYSENSEEVRKPVFFSDAFQFIQVVGSRWPVIA